MIRPVLAVSVLLMVVFPIIPAFADTGSFLVESGKTFQVSYIATGVKIQDIETSPANEELIVDVQVSSSPASLELTIPRNLLDSKQGSADTPFLAVVDGTFVNIKEINPTSTTRTVIVPLSTSNSQIEIIGTYVASPGPSGASIQTVQPPSNHTTLPAPQSPQQLPRVTAPQTPVVHNQTMTGAQKENVTTQSSLANQTQNIVVRIPYLPNMAIHISHIDLAVIAAIIILAIIVASVARRRPSKIVWTR